MSSEGNLRTMAAVSDLSGNVVDRDAAWAINEIERLRGALRKISQRPSKMIWGEDHECREAMNDMEKMADAALAETSVNGETDEEE